MKATQGHLPINQAYTFVKAIYSGKYAGDSIGLPAACCENCDKPISNIAIVQGSEDKRQYRIGLDCAATLTGIIPSEIAEAKKRMAQEAKFRKWLTCEMVSFVVMDGRAYLYDYALEAKEYKDMDLQRWAKWKCSYEKYGASLPAAKQYSITGSREEPYEYSEGTYTLLTLAAPTA